MDVAEGPPGRDVDALWRAHGPAVVRYARRRVGPADVDEVVAETFVVAWRRRGEVPDPPLPWLLGVARGVSANLHRAARRRDALRDRLTTAGPGGLDSSNPGDPGVDTGDVTAGVAAALARLHENDRELLLLLAWDGLTHNDAARALDCSRGALTVRLHRARRRLRAELDRSADPAEPARPAAHPHALTGRSS